MWYLDEQADSAKACRVFHEYSALAAPLAAELEGQRADEANKGKKSKKGKKGAEDDESDDEEEDGEEKEEK